MDPRWAESFDNRATVFERLGMYPQAEADRRKVQELGGVQRPEPPPPPDPAAGRKRQQPRVQPAPKTASAAAQDTPGVPRYPARTAGRGSGGAAARNLGTLLVGVGLLAAAGIGVYLAVNTISGAFDDDDNQVAVPGEQETGTPEASGGVSASPTPDDDEALAGSPLSFTRFDSAWGDQGLTATPGTEAEGLSGFEATPVTVTLTRAGQTMVLAMLFYDGPGELAQDWTLSPNAATPKTGRTIPTGSGAPWFNNNVIVVVLELNDSLKPDVFSAFVSVSA